MVMINLGSVIAIFHKFVCKYSKNWVKKRIFAKE